MALAVSRSREARRDVTDTLAYHLDLLRGLRAEQRRAIEEMAAGDKDERQGDVSVSRYRQIPDCARLTLRRHRMAGVGRQCGAHLGRAL
jgi:hypothetical protein